jgi:hypothetical protein
VTNGARSCRSPSAPCGIVPSKLFSSTWICSAIAAASASAAVGSGGGVSSTGAPGSANTRPSLVVTSSRSRTPSAGITSPRSERTPLEKLTPITHGIPYSRERIPRWLSGWPCRVTTPFTPEVSAGVRNVVVPPRASTIVSATSPLVTKSMTACGVSRKTTGPSTVASSSNTLMPRPTSVY